MALLRAAEAEAADGFWSSAAGGSWASSGNWDGGDIADGTDNTAYFGVLANAPANATVTLDGARTIGNLFFTDQSGVDNWILNTGTAGPLTLAATFDLPSITVALTGRPRGCDRLCVGGRGWDGKT